MEWDSRGGGDYLQRVPLTAEQACTAFLVHSSFPSIKIKTSNLMLRTEEGAEQGVLWWASGVERFLQDGESMGLCQLNRQRLSDGLRDEVAVPPLQGPRHTCIPSALG